MGVVATHPIIMVSLIEVEVKEGGGGGGQTIYRILYRVLDMHVKSVKQFTHYNNMILFQEPKSGPLHEF